MRARGNVDCATPTTSNRRRLQRLRIRYCRQQLAARTTVDMEARLGCPSRRLHRRIVESELRPDFERSAPAGDDHLDVAGPSQTTTQAVATDLGIATRPRCAGVGRSGCCHRERPDCCRSRQTGRASLEPLLGLPRPPSSGSPVPDTRSVGPGFMRDCGTMRSRISPV